MNFTWHRLTPRLVPWRRSPWVMLIQILEIECRTSKRHDVIVNPINSIFHGCLLLSPEHSSNKNLDNYEIMTVCFLGGLTTWPASGLSQRVLDQNLVQARSFNFERFPRKISDTWTHPFGWAEIVQNFTNVLSLFIF